MPSRTGRTDSWLRRRLHQLGGLGNNAIGLFKSYKLLGIAYGCNNNYEEAVRYLRKAINTFPKGEGMTDLMNTYAYLNMALECTDQKEVIDTVMTEWKAVLDQKPPVQGDKDFLAVVSWHFHYHMTLAKHLLEKKQLKAATAELDSAEYYKKIDSDSQEGADQLTIFPRDTHAAQHPLRLHTGHHNTRHGDR
jgi:tetratricopeptide (TPR) repeat protein